VSATRIFFAKKSIAKPLLTVTTDALHWTPTAGGASRGFFEVVTLTKAGE
jgi:hypothetical protein